MADHRRRRVSEPLALAMAAAVLTALIVWLAPPGTDFAAHAYQRSLFARQGFGIWDNGWYAGRYEFVTYSVLYYPLAAAFGIAAVAVATQAIAVGAFAALVRDEFGAQGAGRRGPSPSCGRRSCSPRPSRRRWA